MVLARLVIWAASAAGVPPAHRSPTSRLWTPGSPRREMAWCVPRTRAWCPCPRPCVVGPPLGPACLPVRSALCARVSRGDGGSGFGGCGLRWVRPTSWPRPGWAICAICGVASRGAWPQLVPRLIVCPSAFLLRVSAPASCCVNSGLGEGPSVLSHVWTGVCVGCGSCVACPSSA